MNSVFIEVKERPDKIKQWDMVELTDDSVEQLFEFIDNLLAYQTEEEE